MFCGRDWEAAEMGKETAQNIQGMNILLSTQSFVVFYSGKQLKHLPLDASFKWQLCIHKVSWF